MSHSKSSKLPGSYILDNGAYAAKIGTCLSKHPEIVPNCIMKVKSERRRLFIGDQINECMDASGLYYIMPFQRGYIINWDVQKTVWDYIFSKPICSAKLSETPICITEPIFNFQSNQEAMDEIFFEEYDTCGVLRVTAPDLCAYHYSKTNGNCKNMLVIDTGSSFTHIIPFINGKKFMAGVKRIDVGGKVLTNHLKEIISYRQLHVMDETYVINQVKEDACYVSIDFRSDMMQTSHKDQRNKIVTEYVLPDFNTIKRGYLRKLKTLDQSENTEENDPNSIQQQTIILNNERITIPEILFHPSDIGISQMGIAEAVAESIRECPENAAFPLLGNIVVMGGNAHFPNFGRRLYNEIRQRFDEHMIVNVFVPPNPTTYAWFGGKMLTKEEEFYSFMISKDEYEEHGHSSTRERLQTFSI